LIEVSLDQTPDETERRHLMNLPTSFKLSAKDVDRLRDAARDILSASDDFQRLVSDLQ
jgi:NTE family protein